MSKIIKFPISQYEPIECIFCGAIYEFEKGDHIYILGNENTGRMVNGDLAGETVTLLQCPVCGMGNELVRKDKNNEKTTD